MKRIWIIPVVAMALMLSVNDARGQDDGELAFELAKLREAWLYGDNQTAAARLDTLREDNRLGGWLPRWYAGMRAWIALEEGDDDTAREVLQPVLEDSRDARSYLRACRLMLTFGNDEKAEEAIDGGLKRAPESPALLRFKAGLQWLRGDYDAAMESYQALLCLDERVNYPWVSPATHPWSDVTPWPAPVDGEIKEDKEDEEEFVELPGQDLAEDEPVPEPHISLFTSARWYPSDLPGLARCIDELAANSEMVKTRADRLDGRIESARQHQHAHDTYRDGNLDTREQLYKAWQTANWDARLDARVVARAYVLDERFEDALEVISKALTLDSDDVALLDLQAQAQGALGMAEEARTGPLEKLKRLADLSVSVYGILDAGPQRQSGDRLFTPALNLYRANPEAGKQQFEEVRRTFTRDSRGTPIHPGVVGVWLYLQDEHELAREYLLEASRFNGHDSGKPLYGDAVRMEIALLAIGEDQATTDEDEAEPAEDGEIEQPADDEEVESVEMADVGDAHPLVRRALRAGGVIGATHDTRAYIRDIAGVDAYGGSAGFSSLMGAARAYPGGEGLAYEVLYGMPERLADEAGAAEIERWLSKDSPISESLTRALESMSDTIGQLQTSNSWRVRQALGQKAGPVFGMVEARAMLLRAKLRLDQPQNMEELAAWLKSNQALIDLRAHLQKAPDDDHLRMRDAREQAGMPEVVHNGLLLDCAQLLARAGRHTEAAELVWHNRTVRLGVETRGHLLALAGVLARTGGDESLAARCRIENATRAVADYAGERGWFELPLVRQNLLEFGNAGDVLEYVENQMIPYSTSEDVPRIHHTVPESKQARPTLFMRNPSHLGLENIFEASVTGASCEVIHRNWNKLILSTDTLLTARRLAAWVVVSDLPIVQRGRSFAGCNTADDTVRGWAMLRELHRKAGEDEPAARLAKLIERTDKAIDDAQGARYWEDE